MRYALLMVLATMVAATAVIAIKLSMVPPSWLAVGRLTVATAVLLPIFAHLWCKPHPGFGWKELLRGCLPGFFLGLHFISWNYGARMTVASNATLLVNFVPVAMPLLLVFLAREHLGKRETIGTIVATAGVLTLVGADFQFNREYFLGDVVCFLSMTVYACYLALGRRNRDIPHLVFYLVPVYASAALTCLVVALITEADFLGQSLSLQEWGIIAYLGLLPTVVGHSLFNLCLKHLRGQQVGLLNQTQFLWATILGFLILKEVPTPAFYPAAALMTAGAAIALRQRRVPPQKGFTGAETPRKHARPVDPRLTQTEE